MGDATVKGYTDPIGKHGLAVIDHTGPLSYTTGGETLKANGGPGSLGGLRSLDMVVPIGVSVSGNYCVQAKFSSTGVQQQCKLIWLFSPLNTLSGTAWTEVSSTTNLSGETVRLLCVGG